jgi:UDP-glucose 4-epimerase
LDNKPVKCCVIGGAGFIGVHVTRRLVDSGRRVIVLGRRTPPDKNLPAEATYVSGDYDNRAVLKDILSGVAEVIDLAYATVPQTSFDDPFFDIRSNLPASLGLLHEAAAAGVRKLVLVSSGGTVYGAANSLPIGEDHPTNPISPYGITKLTIEKYAWMFQLVSDLPVVVVRPGNAYGEEQRPFVGQGFIATAIHSIIRGQEVAIFGPEGTIRDYVHVSDVASGIVAALDQGKPGSIYNIGSGVGRSNLDVLREIEPLAMQAGYSLRLTTLPPRRFDVPANILDIRKLYAASGWWPQVSFTSGVARVWRTVLDGYRGV